MELSESIKLIRRKCLMNQTEFADALEVSFSTVNRWENGKSIPNYQALKKIKKFCDANNLPFTIDDAIWEDNR